MSKVIDSALVCGYPACDDGQVSDIMKSRMNTAVHLWKQGKVKCLIVSGGAVANAYVEAEVMKAYAVENGVPKELIYEEKCAVSTYHNMLYAKEIMQEHQIKNCMIVTNGWHHNKASHYAKKFGLDYVMVRAERPENETFFMTIGRYIGVNLHMFYMRLKGYY